MGKAIPIIPGQRFGFLTVIFPANNLKGGLAKVLAKCDCGSLKQYYVGNVRSGHTKSCGCKKGKQKAESLLKKHGPQFIVDGDIARAKIKGKVFLVDSAIAEDVNKYRWQVSTHGYCYNIRPSTKEKVSLHRMVSGARKGDHVDHINGDVTDNRASNLRLCTHQQNMFNMKSTAGSSSKYKGVCWASREAKWLARISINRKAKHIGFFSCERKAAEMYDLAALRYFGRFARLNFPIEGLV